MPSETELLERLFGWQTLLSGILALLAALATIYLINKQITLAAKQEADRRARRARAIRSTLPLALSEMTGLTHKIVADLSAIAASNPQGTLANAIRNYEFSEPSSETISILKEMIEFSDSNIAVKVLAEIISEMQILFANLRSPKDHKDISVTRHNLRSYACRAIKIHSLASILFSYARSEVEDIEIEDFKKSCQTALIAFGVGDHQFPGISQAVQRIEPFRPTRA
jgi:alcohol dehydrogenase class IV